MTIVIIPGQFRGEPHPVGKLAITRGGVVPSIIQLRQAAVLSLAHQIDLDFSGESPPRMGMTKV